MSSHLLGWKQRQHAVWCVHVCQLAPNPRGFYGVKVTLEWPISSQRLVHLYLSVFCKGRQIGTSPHYNMLFWLGHNSATGLGHGGARSLALQEESGPEPFPGGLDADSDVVPTVRCQQEKGVRRSAWVWDVVCVKWGEKTEGLRAYVCMRVCLYVLPSLCKVFLTQD